VIRYPVPERARISRLKRKGEGGRPKWPPAYTARSSLKEKTPSLPMALWTVTKRSFPLYRTQGEEKEEKKRERKEKRELVCFVSCLGHADRVQN
jgi:hypothetical protein